MKTALGAFSAVAALTLAALVHADPGGDQAGLSQPFSEAGGPYIGQWGAHGESLTVDSDGTGSETYSGGTVNFKLGSVQGPPPAAYGYVTGGVKEVGSYVTLTLVDGGQGLLLSVGGGDQNFPFCKIVNGNKVNSYDCGA
jgi:hypothetical protein